MSKLDSAKQPLAHYYTMPSFGVRLYSALRMTIFPYAWLSSLLTGVRGKVYCLGCGYGILETMLAVDHPNLTIIASDLAADRIKIAKEAVKDVKNIEFKVEDATTITQKGIYDAILFIDLLHHLPQGQQTVLLDKLWAMLKPGGYLIMKDVDTQPRWKYYWNYLHDSLMAGQPLTYFPSHYYKDYFKTQAETVTYLVPKPFHSPYNHYALKVKKPK